MSDGFVELIDRANAFFTELRANNTKAFYEARKGFYTAEIKKPGELLGDILGEELSRATGRALKPKLFRIHRDVRFSKDKTPYNAHLHLMWSTPVDGAPLWFFGAAPDYVTVGMGVMAGKGAALTRLRALIDREGDEIAGALGAAPGIALSDWGPAPLKRVPKPYDPAHPHGALLKRKSLVVSAPPAPDWRDAGLIPGVMRTARAMLPLWQILDAEFGA